MSSWFSLACSGLMYSNVPRIWPYCVKSVFSVSRRVVAFATPKSMIFRVALHHRTSYQYDP